jgi:(5-formylfuran-3-yl)methyl phosphate synthase
MNQRIASTAEASLPALLVSVRSADEALAALAGGAGLIDVKEPSRGSLGRAGDREIAAVIDAVAGRCPVSAAMGELIDGNPPFRETRLAFLKWGLAECTSPPAATPGWRDTLQKHLSYPGNPKTVIVAYADWQCARAPDLWEVIAFACETPGNVLLIDTHCKDPATLGKDHRPTLLDWVRPEWIEDACDRCRRAGIRVALAGSLGMAEIAALRGTRPDWFAVRGAVCSDGDRNLCIDTDKVRRLAESLVG